MKLGLLDHARHAGNVLLAGAVLGTTLPAHARNAETSRPEAARFNLEAAPLYFEANRGQAANGVSFIARGTGSSVLLAPDEAVIVLASRRETSDDSTLERLAPDRHQPMETYSVHYRFVGANPRAALSGIDALPGRANYLIGREPSAWRTAIPLFTRVRADEVYPGVTLIYYCSGDRLEYDFQLQPHARAEQIALQITGADTIRINPAGELELTVGPELIRQHQPVIYQTVNGVRKIITGGYYLRGRDTVGFQLGEYDHDLPLVIDPTLTFSTYLGGKKLDIGWGVGLDGAGNIYVAGEALSTGLEGTNLVAAGTPLYPNHYNGGTKAFGDAFVAKYDALTHQLNYLTYVGGKTDDGALGLAVDPAGRAYLTGFTDSIDFPITNGFRTSLSGTNLNAKRLYPADAFVAKIDTDGSTLLYSSLLGGSRRDQGLGIAVDGFECAYVTGFTESTNFVVTNTVAPLTELVFEYTNSVSTNFITNFVASVVQLTNAGRADAFVAKVDTTAAGPGSLLFSSYLGGTNNDYGLGIAVGAGGNALVTGYTASTNFPTLNALVISNAFYTNTYFGTNLNTQINRSTANDAFVCKLAADGSTFVYSSYLGGSNSDAGLSIAVDASDFAYVTGYTFSWNFPTNWIAQPRSSGTNYSSHVFVTKIGPNGADDVPYSIEFGSSRTGEGTGIAVDAAMNVYVTGFCTWTNFFDTNSPALTVADLRSPDAIARESKTVNRGFVTVIGAAETNFLHAVYLGGRGSDQPNAIAVSVSATETNVIVVGQTSSKDFPTNNATQIYLGGTKKKSGTDAFVEQIQLP